MSLPVLRYHHDTTQVLKLPKKGPQKFKPCRSSFVKLGGGGGRAGRSWCRSCFSWCLARLDRWLLWLSPRCFRFLWLELLALPANGRFFLLNMKEFLKCKPWISDVQKEYNKLWFVCLFRRESSDLTSLQKPFIQEIPQCKNNVNTSGSGATLYTWGHSSLSQSQSNIYTSWG